jgi:hypothetical protein
MNSGSRTKFTKPIFEVYKEEKIIVENVSYRCDMTLAQDSTQSKYFIR